MRKSLLWILACPIGVGLLFTYLYCGPTDSPKATIHASKPPDRAGRRGVGNLWYDLVEDDPQLKPTFVAAELEAKEMLPRTHEKGWGAIFESTKKRILKDKYGLEWRTTKELNPSAIFD
jgi:hypothetical protein